MSVVLWDRNVLNVAGIQSCTQHAELAWLSAVRSVLGILDVLQGMQVGKQLGHEQHAGEHNDSSES